MHLYVHVPFCARRCSYCDFAIAVRREVPSAEFVGAVLAEWGQRLAEAPASSASRLDTLYFGGGTPSRLDPPELLRLVEGLAAALPITPGAETTLEANPEDVTRRAADAWRAAGINRVSLGAQSFEPSVLEWMHRTHRVEQVPAAVEVLRDAGIVNLSLDLIYGLPGHLERDWARDLELALVLEPAHLSLYALTVEPATPLAHWIDRGASAAPVDERQAAEFLEAHRRLGQAGYVHYEVSNFAMPGREAVHNQAYWERRPYLGLGPSAHSAAGASRWWNIRDWESWRRAIARGQRAVAGEEELDSGAVVLEELYLGLRTRRGVPVERVRPELREAWIRAGWAENLGDRLCLLPEGWLRLDALVAQAAR